MLLDHGVWKSKKKSHSSMRAELATFIFWVDKSSSKNLNLSVKNLWKMSKFKMRLFREFSNTLLDEESSHVNFFWDFYHAKGKLWHPSAAAWQLLKGLPLLSVFWVENQISIEISLHTELRITWMLGSSFGLLNLHQCTASRKRLCISFIDTQ